MFGELLKESRLDWTLKYFDKDKQKFKRTRLIYGVVFVIIALMFIAYLQNYILFTAIPIVFLLGYKMPYHTLLSAKTKNDKLNTHLFPEFLTSFVAIIPSSGNVYQTLVGTLPYTKEPLRSGLQRLVDRIEDKNDRDAYIEFAEYIGSSEAYMIMDMIYQFSEFGIKKEALVEMQRFGQELEKNKMTELIERKMASMEGLGFIPIFISMLVIVGFTAIIIYHYFVGVLSVLNVT